MTTANCAVSMGKVGSDAAIEASDIVLVTDNLNLLPKAKKIAKKTRVIVFENIIGSLLVKFAIMALSVALPSFPMIVAIFADVGVMLLAVLNAMRTGLIK
jgi:Cd2+/Zn2+-exporting ATPase